MRKTETCKPNFEVNEDVIQYPFYINNNNGEKFLIFPVMQLIETKVLEMGSCRPFSSLGFLVRSYHPGIVITALRKFFPLRKARHTQAEKKGTEWTTEWLKWKVRTQQFCQLIWKHNRKSFWAWLNFFHSVFYFCYSIANRRHCLRFHLPKQKCQHAAACIVILNFPNQECDL